jgi:hypothetical protein
MEKSLQSKSSESMEPSPQSGSQESAHQRGRTDAQAVLIESRTDAPRFHGQLPHFFKQVTDFSSQNLRDRTFGIGRTPVTP